ncbi:MAG TPA: TIGR03013 family XrtA/PEP-CTERM system glycosyltransferase [Spongiibacteraceae bacterium]|nr:TIGR03013 family PEP-CTERM/XrtA system glycosyltransferase [Spongiibacteraceae bacterium]HUH36847.1 TIGR03013 family XrtA/PEP-CTERM system glycosyltransferase [Spongiibacteraceae bacterium]
MAHVRLFNQHLYLPVLFLIVVEYGVFVASVYFGVALRFDNFNLDSVAFADLAPRAHFFALVMIVCSLSMGVYNTYGREGLTGMMLRTVVSSALVGAVLVSVFLYLIPSLQLFLGRGVLALAVGVALLLLLAVRIVFYRLIDTARLRRRVLVLGSGVRAARMMNELLASFTSKATKRDFEIVGFVKHGGPVAVEGNVIDVPASALHEYCADHRVDEIVVAVDERRSGDGNGGLPVIELLDCKFKGVDVLDELAFYEREGRRLDIRLVSTGWLVFAEGFRFSWWRDVGERGFDVFASLLLLVVSWPIMLLTVLAIKLEEGWRAPVLYHQPRVGLNGAVFNVHKFRSMRVDAERGGKAIWARQNDDRITLVGRFIRQTRIDELPQIFNVLRGEMSFVGPRPERPEFVDNLARSIPFYNERHRVKPGLTGWAQLCYPYGASEEDAEKKLQYDLYYIKNHSLFFDFYILIRTVEVILIGQGVR